MKNDELSILMIQCGCLNDIAEKCKDEYTGRQIKEVQIKLEKIANKYYNKYTYTQKEKEYEKNQRTDKQPPKMD